jgi:hypothetical protein
MSLDSALQIESILTKFICVKDILHLILVYTCDAKQLLQKNNKYSILCVNSLAQNLPMRKETLILGKFETKTAFEEIFTMIRIWPYMISKPKCTFCFRKAENQMVVYATCGETLFRTWHDICVYHGDIFYHYNNKQYEWNKRKDICIVKRRKVN